LFLQDFLFFAQLFVRLVFVSAGGYEAAVARARRHKSRQGAEETKSSKKEKEEGPE
jgi:hypothetical protein